MAHFVGRLNQQEPALAPHWPIKWALGLVWNRTVQHPAKLDSSSQRNWLTVLRAALANGGVCWLQLVADPLRGSADQAHELGSWSYSKSFDFGFRPGSLDKKPKIKRETKKITTV
jgi:hypothetical protein